MSALLEFVWSKLFKNIEAVCRESDNAVERLRKLLTRPPRINHEILANICEMPKVVARCPVAAIRPTVVDGLPVRLYQNGDER